MAPAVMGCSIPRVPLGSAGLPSEGSRGMVLEPTRGVMPVAMGTRGLSEVIGVMAESGVVMGMGVSIATPPGIIDRFGKEPIPYTLLPKCELEMAIEGAWLVRETGGCFMMIGRAEGRGVPWSLSLISFMAMENSSLSILPSLFMSARVQISARTDEGRPDCRKNFLACSADTKPKEGERVSNFWSCLSLSSGVMAHTLTPPFIVAGGQGRGDSQSCAQLQLASTQSTLTTGENMDFRLSWVPNSKSI